MKPKTTKPKPLATRALTALKKSIQHWERLVSGKTLPGEEIGWSDCALCKEFLYPDTGGATCRGCPVYERTRLPNCHGSPYDAISYLRGSRFGCQLEKWMQSDEFKTLAANELAFLKSLLPKNSTTKKK